VLFYFANTATLPLVGEILTQGKQGRRSAWEVAAAVLVAEALMVVAPIGCGKLADKWGRKRLFLIGFAFLAVRNGLTVLNHNEFYLISLQALDGVCDGNSWSASDADHGRPSQGYRALQHVTRRGAVLHWAWRSP
jgi:MFS family permease